MNTSQNTQIGSWHEAESAPNFGDRVSRLIMPGSLYTAAGLLLAISYNGYQESDAPTCVIGTIAALGFAATGYAWSKIDSRRMNS